MNKLILAAVAVLSIRCAAAHATPSDLPPVAAATAGSVGEGTSQAVATAGPVPGPVSLKVSYADTLQGVSALYAVRVCAYDGQTGAYPRLVEVKSSGLADIELQLIDENGAEVSHYSGSKAVCDYARFAAAFAARSVKTKVASHD